MGCSVKVPLLLVWPEALPVVGKQRDGPMGHATLFDQVLIASISLSDPLLMGLHTGVG